MRTPTAPPGIDSRVLSIPDHGQNEKPVGVMSASSMLSALDRLSPDLHSRSLPERKARRSLLAYSSHRADGIDSHPIFIPNHCQNEKPVGVMSASMLTTAPPGIDSHVLSIPDHCHDEKPVGVYGREDHDRATWHRLSRAFLYAQVTK